MTLKPNSYKYILVLLWVFFHANLSAQKNITLFFMYDVPESHLLNPATELTCKWYVGLPVLSSLHANYANSTFSYNQIFTASS